MKKPYSLSAAALACVLVLVLLFSVFFIVLEADHDCCGDDCAICAVLSVCEGLLQRPARTGEFAGIVLLFGILTLSAAVQHVPACALCTPVSLRVKLTD